VEPYYYKLFRKSSKDPVDVGVAFVVVDHTHHAAVFNLLSSVVSASFDIVHLMLVAAFFNASHSALDAAPNVTHDSFASANVFNIRLFLI
jgi:hypothetical protein